VSLPGAPSPANLSTRDKTVKVHHFRVGYNALSTQDSAVLMPLLELGTQDSAVLIPLLERKAL
jgi:hypothetical protein